MLKTTCCVHPGFSGGALFRPNGELLGVVVSNAKLLENGVSFPRMNMCIPLSAISGVIREFLQTEGRENGRELVVFYFKIKISDHCPRTLICVPVFTNIKNIIYQ